MRKITVVVMLFVLVAIVVSSCGAFVDESVAVRAMETQGYSNVKITGKHIWFTSWQGCGKEDDVKFDVVATNPIGKRVELFVCAGWLFKGATVRSR